MTLAYHVVDVFTDEAFAGNPLAVVLDADDLSTEQMQSIAREFNLSETTFPTRPTVSGADYRLRIFTPTTELPFAGHPSVGTAWVLRSLDRIGSGRVMQECGAGVLPLDIGAAEATLTGGLPTVGEPLDPVPFLAAVGLTVDDLVGTPVRSAGMGLEFVFLHVSDDAVTRSMPELAAIMALDHVGISVFAYDDGRAHARVYAGGSGVLEDPATGSAALGLGVWLVASGLADPDGTTSYVVEQGIEMGRPSRLGCTVDATNGQVVRGTVSGNVVPVAQGTITAP